MTLIESIGRALSTGCCETLCARVYVSESGVGGLCPSYRDGTIREYWVSHFISSLLLHSPLLFVLLARSDSVAGLHVAACSVQTGD